VRNYKGKETPEKLAYPHLCLRGQHLFADNPPGRRDCGAYQPDNGTEPISHRDPQNPGLLASFAGETGLDRAEQGVERHLQKIA